ncbi:hypothetical protein JB92DRAFT_2904358 [Gautieria morchelliformis]|nr:hypothetical protein JB92DRAFT_2904358 [Gautieria morchelliformis]
MGDIPSKSNMSSLAQACELSNKIHAGLTQCTVNFGTVAANTSFDISLEITGLQTGAFVNPDTNYFGASQQLNSKGQIIGHSHFVIEQINSLQDTGLTATVAKGLPAGVYRAATINTAGNYQPLLVSVAQHGSLDDMIYFTVSANGAKAANSTSVSAVTSATGVQSSRQPRAPQSVSSPPAQPPPLQLVPSPPAQPPPPQPMPSPPAQPRALLKRKRLSLALRERTTTTTVAVVRHGYVIHPPFCYVLTHSFQRLARL